MKLLPAARNARGPIIALALLLAALRAGAEGVPVQTVDGEPGDLVDFLSTDKWTVVMIWTSYCGLCEPQYEILSAFHRDHAAKDAVVLGISLDGYDKGELVREHQAAHDHAFPSVVTEVDAFAPRYQLTTGVEFSGTPTYLVFDRERRLRTFHDDLTTRRAIEAVIAQ